MSIIIVSKYKGENRHPSISERSAGNPLSLYSVIITFSPYQPRTDMKAQISSLNDKRPNIGITCRHWHRTEDAIALTSRDNPDIIAGILFEA